MGKGNQMTALGFQTGEEHVTSPASLQGWRQTINSLNNANCYTDQFTLIFLLGDSSPVHVYMYLKNKTKQNLTFQILISEYVTVSESVTA